MKILTISGSARPESSNTKLLNHLHTLNDSLTFYHSKLPSQLPLFNSALMDASMPLLVREWEQELKQADGVIICTPEYLHNMPAMIKNALEWVTASGELADKKVLAMTFTPMAPRGDRAMESLLWSLKALKSNVVASLSLYQTEISYTKEGTIGGEGADMLREALQLFS